MLISLIKHLFQGAGPNADSPAPDSRQLSQNDTHKDYAELMAQARQNFDSGNYAQARSDSEQLIELDPADSQGWLQLGRTLNKQKDYDAAAKALDMAVALGPEVAAIYFERGISFERSRRFDLALKDYGRVLELKPKSVSALISQGRTHYQLGNFDLALACNERALKIEPDNVLANQSLALRLRDLGRPEDAERALRRTVDLPTDNIKSMCYLALVLIEAGRIAEARRWIDRVLAIDPVSNEARWNLALILLLEGNFKDGWSYYESRRFRHDVLPRPYRFPEWDGSPMPNGTLLICAEQGLGDDIFFASCFAETMQRVGRTVIECEPRLVKLFTRSFPTAVVHGSKLDAKPAWIERADPVSAQIAAGSLPQHFRTGLQDFPLHSGYLRAEESRVGHWRARLDDLGNGLKVGLAWTGGSMKTRRRLRSVPPADLIPLLRVVGAHFVSLQYGDSADELAFLRDSHQLTVHHWQQAIDDYDETAALVYALDLVISVQTTVVHLCGALGRPVWVLVPASPEWRYLADGTTMPWYPSARLFRQRRHESWEPVISAVAAELTRVSRN